MSRLSTYLNHTHAGVQEDGSFGLFGDLLIFVEVQVIGAVSELGQVEISPLKGLGQTCRYGIWKEQSIKTFMFHFSLYVMYLSPRFLKCQHFRSKGIEIQVSTVFNSFSYTSYMCLTLMVTLMALFMLPLHSQPCLETPPFWDPSEAVSCRGWKSRSHTVNSPDWPEKGVRLRIAVPAEGKYHTAFSMRRYRTFRVN